MKRAEAICMGEENEYWNDMTDLIKPCAEYMANQINQRITLLNKFDSKNKRTINLA
jgi:hypothetical protein